MGSTRLVVKVESAVALKTAACVSLCSVGMFYLIRGKEEADLDKMILGGVLVIASMFVFY